MKLFKNESGAVTVDWVVLAAALVLLAGGIIAVVNTGLQTAATSIATQVNNAVTASN